MVSTLFSSAGSSASVASAVPDVEALGVVGLLISFNRLTASPVPRQHPCIVADPQSTDRTFSHERAVDVEHISRADVLCAVLLKLRQAVANAARGKVGGRVSECHGAHRSGWWRLLRTAGSSALPWLGRLIAARYAGPSQPFAREGRELRRLTLRTAGPTTCRSPSSASTNPSSPQARSPTPSVAYQPLDPCLAPTQAAAESPPSGAPALERADVAVAVAAGLGRT
jgi:hypothetical protein